MADAVHDRGATPGESGAQIAPLPRISVQAFCETRDVAQVIQTATSDRRMTKAHFKVNMGGVPAAIEAFRSASTPNLIVLETLVSRDTLIAQLEALAEYCDPGTKVVVIGHENDIALYRDLLSRGVSDYIVAPFGVLEFIQQISELYNAAGAEPVGRLIAVFGAKGGVGASTISHNVAWGISRAFDQHTIIADLDLPFGTAGLDFNQDPPQGIAEAVFSSERLDANMVERLLSKCSERLSILASPAAIERGYDLPEGVFDPMLDILRSASPCTVLDVPHQWNSWTRRVLISCDEVAIVTAPDLGNLRNTKTLVDTLRLARPNDAPPRLVLNLVGIPKRPEIAVDEFAKAVGTDPAAVIPFEPKLFGMAGNNGQMLAEIEPGSPIVESLNALGAELMGRAAIRRGKKTLLAPLLERFMGKKAS